MSFDEQPDGYPHGECAAEIHQLQAELAQERAKREAVERDAQRYRWLRLATQAGGEIPDNTWWEKLGDALGEEFDTAIDTALAAKDSSSAGMP